MGEYGATTGRAETDRAQGLEYGEVRIKKLKDDAVLKRETDMVDCAAAFVMLAKNTSMTGQRVQVDSGLKVDNM